MLKAVAAGLALMVMVVGCGVVMSNASDDSRQTADARDSSDRADDGDDTSDGSDRPVAMLEAACRMLSDGDSEELTYETMRDVYDHTLGDPYPEASARHVMSEAEDLGCAIGAAETELFAQTANDMWTMMNTQQRVAACELIDEAEVGTVRSLYATEFDGLTELQREWVANEIVIMLRREC